jgi:hypothetical protein
MVEQGMFKVRGLGVGIGHSVGKEAGDFKRVLSW